jgi:hypothetical protein
MPPIDIKLVANPKLKPGTAVMVSWTEEYMRAVSELAVLQLTRQISAGEANRRLDTLARHMARERRVVVVKNIGEPDATTSPQQAAGSQTTPE